MTYWHIMRQLWWRDFHIKFYLISTNLSPYVTHFLVWSWLESDIFPLITGTTLFTIVIESRITFVSHVSFKWFTPWPHWILPSLLQQLLNIFFAAVIICNRYFLPESWNKCWFPQGNSAGSGKQVVPMSSWSRPCPFLSYIFLFF